MPGTAPHASGLGVVVLGAAGAAAQVAAAGTELREAGYDVLNISGSAARSSVVYYTPGNQDAATALAQAEGGLAVQQFPDAGIPGLAGGPGGAVVLVLGPGFRPGRFAVPPAPAAGAPAVGPC